MVLAQVSSIVQRINNVVGSFIKSRFHILVWTMKNVL